MSLLTYSSLMIRYWVPPIRVHCWGGLGSQLFGWSLYEDLQIRYPSRRIHVYLHQGGVTQRPSEIDHVFEKGIIFKVFDYDPEFQINNNEVSSIVAGRYPELESFIVDEISELIVKHSANVQMTQNGYKEVVIPESELQDVLAIVADSQPELAAQLVKDLTTKLN